MPSEFLTIEQAATFLNVSNITLKRYLRENLIPSSKQNGQPLIDKAALERYKAINDQFKR
ncbi:helix-turn-helix domain-containing protein [Reinekea sp.]|jgi:excisionase family DNA binding protein|uniref:helix-turn-helix domain-containing protein n=1 Tax=Reinekea sp. TaxID=1970455 RepID=UPI003988C63F